MIFSCTQENFNKAINKVSKIVSSRGSLPILSNILITTDNGQLKLSATNLEIGINTWIGAKIDKEGSISISAKLLQEFISINKDKKLDFIAKTNTLNIKSEKYNTNIKGLPADEFPLIPNIKKELFTKINSNILQEAILQTSFSCALDETRPILTGVLFKFENNKLKLAATDSYRLAEKTIQLPQKVKKDIQIIVPQRTVLELARILSESEGEVEIYVEENQIMFVFNNTEFISRLVEGSFPDYQQIIPQKFQTKAIINKEEFSNALKIGSIFARDMANNIKIKFLDNILEVTAVSPQIGDNLAKIKSQITGKNLEIAFNAKFILDFLNIQNTENIIIEAVDKTTAVVFKNPNDSDYLYIVMPLRIEE